MDTFEYVYKLTQSSQHTGKVWRYRRGSKLLVYFFKKSGHSGAPGWLSRLSFRVRLRTWPHGSWVRAPHWALCWQLGAWILLQILSPSLSGPSPLKLACSLSLKINKHFFFFFFFFKSEHSSCAWSFSSFWVSCHLLSLLQGHLNLSSGEEKWDYCLHLIQV